MNDCPQEMQLGPVIISPRRIRLPNGLFLRYDDARLKIYGVESYSKISARPSRA